MAEGLSIKIFKYCHQLSVFLVPAHLPVSQSRLVGLVGLVVRDEAELSSQ